MVIGTGLEAIKLAPVFHTLAVSPLDTPAVPFTVGPLCGDGLSCERILDILVGAT